MDAALLSGRLTVEQLEARLELYALSRRHGLPLMRAFIEERREDGWTPPESELESRGVAVLARIPAGWERQYPLPFRGPANGRVDFALPSSRLIIELDGRRWHARVADFDRDRWRDNEAIAAGWKVLRFTWVHITTAPDAVVDLIRRTLSLAA